MASTDRPEKFRDSFQVWVWNRDASGDNILRKGLRALVRICLIVWREMERDRINLRAAALTYTVILSLVPTLALGTAVLKGLGAGDQMRQAAYRIIDQLEGPEQVPAGQDQAEAAAPAPPAAQQASPESVAPENAGPEPPERSLTVHLRRAVDQLFDYVEHTNFTTLGAFGMVGLIMAVLAMLGSIEQALNTIWQAQSDRPFGRRLMDYLALLILMPIAINLALATETAIQTPALLQRLQQIFPIVWLIRFLLKLIPLIAVVATFTLLYRFIPNTRVRFLPALAGGICGGAGWLIAQIFYLKLQIGVSRYNAIYGSFATLPLLLLWIHLGWIIFLAGAELAFAVQVRQHYRWQEPGVTPVARLAMAFHIIGQAMRDFHMRKVTDVAALAYRLKTSPAVIIGVVSDLVRGGVLRQIDDEPAGCVPAAPEEEIKPAEIMDLILGRETPLISGADLVAEALNAARARLANRKIMSETIRFSADS